MTRPFPFNCGGARLQQLIESKYRLITVIANATIVEKVRHSVFGTWSSWWELRALRSATTLVVATGSNRRSLRVILPCLFFLVQTPIFVGEQSNVKDLTVQIWSEWVSEKQISKLSSRKMHLLVWNYGSGTSVLSISPGNWPFWDHKKTQMIQHRFKPSLPDKTALLKKHGLSQDDGSCHGGLITSDPGDVKAAHLSSMFIY